MTIIQSDDDKSPWLVKNGVLVKFPNHKPHKCFYYPAGHSPWRLIPNIWCEPALSAAIAPIVVLLRWTLLGRLWQTAGDAPIVFQAEWEESKLFHSGMVDHWSLQ